MILSKSKTRVIMYFLLAIVAVLSMFLLAAWITRPPRILTRDEAQRDAYLHLQSYCNRNDLDISRFNKPKVIRGRMLHYEEDLKAVYSPTWDFYYTYNGKPAITVLIVYDEMDRSTELDDVIEPGEKWPQER